MPADPVHAGVISAWVAIFTVFGTGTLLPASRDRGSGAHAVGAAVPSGADVTVVASGPIAPWRIGALSGCRIADSSAVALVQRLADHRPAAAPSPPATIASSAGIPVIARIAGRGEVTAATPNTRVVRAGVVVIAVLVGGTPWGSGKENLSVSD